MKIIKSYSFLLLAVLVACTEPKSKQRSDFSSIKKYKIIYTNNSYSELIVFDNNDTIYLTDSIQKDLQLYVKVPANNETTQKIRRDIINHLNKKTLLIDRNHALHQGYLEISVENGLNRSSLIQVEVDKNISVSRPISELLRDLKIRYKEVDKIF
ncbi:hypothetical protein [Flavobacterium sp.]|uniref:hypothetical protein n=1 Tax=Flavobacterium sp. TaxID=239 RepID=UPI00261388EB|nr:hypothetical protein [Flavobacterium sp.]